jgi:hypothetical protein
VSIGCKPGHLVMNLMPPYLLGGGDHKRLRKELYKGPPKCTDSPRPPYERSREMPLYKMCIPYCTRSFGRQSGSTARNKGFFAGPTILVLMSKWYQGTAYSSHDNLQKR